MLPILRSVSMLSSHIVQKSMNRSTTTLTLLKESLKLLMLIMNPMLVITTSVPLILVTMDTLVVLTVRTRRRSSAANIQKKTLVKFLDKLVKRLLTQSILRFVKKGSTLTAKKPMRGVIRVPELLIIMQKLWQFPINPDMQKVQEITTRIKH